VRSVLTHAGLDAPYLFAADRSGGLRASISRSTRITRPPASAPIARKLIGETAATRRSGRAACASSSPAVSLERGRRDGRAPPTNGASDAGAEGAGSRTASRSRSRPLSRSKSASVWKSARRAMPDVVAREDREERPRVSARAAAQAPRHVVCVGLRALIPLSLREPPARDRRRGSKDSLFPASCWEASAAMSFRLFSVLPVPRVHHTKFCEVSLASDANATTSLHNGGKHGQGPQ